MDICTRGVEIAIGDKQSLTQLQGELLVYHHQPGVLLADIGRLIPVFLVPVSLLRLSSFDLTSCCV